MAPRPELNSSPLVRGRDRRRGIGGGGRLYRLRCLRAGSRLGCTLLGRKTRPRLRGELGLAAGLLRLKLPDLALQAGERALLLRDLTLDRALLARPLRDDPRLRGARTRQVRTALLDLLAELRHILEDLRILVADPLHHVEAPEEVVEALGAENDLDCPAAVAVDVERPQPICDVYLRGAEALLRNDEVPCVRVEIGVDLLQLHVRVVVGLDRLLELRLRCLDLSENGLRLRTLGLDRRIGSRRGDDGQYRKADHRKGEDFGRSLSRSRTIHKPVRSSKGTSKSGGAHPRGAV